MSTESAAGAGGLSGFMKSRMKSVAVAAALIAGTWFWIALPIEGMTPEGNRIFGALIAWVILLTAEVTDASIITLLWLVFLIIAGLAKPGVALSGFTDNTTWLLMGALMIGQACNSTGLARRVAFRFINLTGERYGTLTMCLLISGAILGLMMPSGTARATLYVPIYMGLCDVMKIEKGSRTALNLVMITIWSAAIGGGCMMWLTGSVLNPIMTSALVKFGVNQTWISYAVYSFPSAVVLMVLTWLTINFVAPPDSPTIGGGREMLRREYEKLGPMSPEERRTLIIVCACVLSWMFGDKIGRLTGLSLGSAWTAMFFGLILFLPRIGVLTGKDIKSISWPSILFIGASLAISPIMELGQIDRWITDNLVSPILEPCLEYGFIGFVLGMYVLCHIIHKLIPSGTGTVALAAPLLIAWGTAHGFDAALMGHMTLHGMRPFIFPYEHTPAILMYSFGFVTMPRFLRCTLSLSLVAVIWYVLSAYYWSWLSGFYH